MTQKLPVGAALNEVYQFMLHRWGTVIRIGWAPMACAVATAVGLMAMILDVKALEALGPGASPQEAVDAAFRAPLPLAILAMFALGILIALVMSGFMASLFRLIALGEEQPGWFHIRFDGPAVRVFLAQLIRGAINMTIFAVAIIAASLISGHSFGAAINAFRLIAEMTAAAEQAGVSPDPQAIGAAARPVVLIPFAMLLAALPMIYVNVRLAPFLAGSAAENRLLLAGSFALTKGNFWPVFLFELLLIISIVALSIVVQLVVSIFDALTMLPETAAFALVIALAGVLAAALTIAFQFVTIGLQLAAQAVIYRRLKTGA